VIARRNGIPIKLKDVADVRDFFKERTFDVRMNGKKAMAILGELPLSEIQTVLEAFTGAIQDGVIPKENRNPSESPSEVSQADSESPAGLESSSKAETGSLPPGK